MKKIYKIDKDTLKPKECIDYKQPFYILLGITVVTIATSLTRSPEIINKIRENKN